MEELLLRCCHLAKENSWLLVVIVVCMVVPPVRIAIQAAEGFYRMAPTDL